MRNSFERISGMLSRYLFLLQSSWTRIFELSFWPLFSMIIWGYTSLYFAQHISTGSYDISVIIAGAILWEFLLRTQLGVVQGFLEEVWSRNLGHLFISPLRTWEWIVSLLALSILRGLLSILPVILVSLLLFKFNLFSLGFPLIAFLVCLLVMGWSLGFVAISIVIRFGAGAEMLAWMITYAVAPVCAAFYPVSVLPHWLQAIAFIMPASHVFEVMRGFIMQHKIDFAELSLAFGLSLIFLILGICVLLRSLNGARNRGALLVVGE